MNELHAMRTFGFACSFGVLYLGEHKQMGSRVAVRAYSSSGGKKRLSRGSRYGRSVASSRKIGSAPPKETSRVGV